MQAIMGSLVKRVWAQQAGKNAGAVYHCAVMPCADKKLEAARDDYFLPGGALPLPATLPIGQFCDSGICRRQTDEIQTFKA